MKKTFFKNVMLLLLLAALAGFIWAAMTDLSHMSYIFHEITRSDMPVIMGVSALKAKSAEQHILMERIFRVAACKKGEPAKAEINQAAAEFERIARSIDQGFLLLDELIDKEKNIAVKISLEEAREAEGEYAELHALLEGLQKQQQVFEGQARTVIGLAQKGKLARAEGAVESVLTEAAMLGKLAQTTAQRVEGFTEAAVEQSARIRNAVAVKLVMLVAVALIAMVGLRYKVF
jgi:hypothetical protein